MAAKRKQAQEAASTPEPSKPAFNPYDVFFAVIVAQCRQNGGTFKFPRALLNDNTPTTLTTTLTDLDVIFTEAKP